MATGAPIIVLEGRGPETRRHQCENAARTQPTGDAPTPTRPAPALDNLRCYQWLQAHGVASREIPSLLNRVREIAMTRLKGQPLRSLDDYALAVPRDGQTFLLDEVWIQWGNERWKTFKAGLDGPRGSGGDLVGLGDVYRDILARRPVGAALPKDSGSVI